MQGLQMCCDTRHGATGAATCPDYIVADNDAAPADPCHLPIRKQNRRGTEAAAIPDTYTLTSQPSRLSSRCRALGCHPSRADGVRPALLDLQKYRRSNEHGTEGTNHDSEGQHDREGTNHLATEHQQRQQRCECGSTGHHGTRKRLVHRPVQQCRKRFLLELLEILTHAVEHNDLVVERVAEHREQATDNEEGDLEIDVPHQRRCGENVGNGGNERSHTEAPLEAPCEVDERNTKRDEQSDYRTLTKLTPNPRAYSFSTDHRVGILTELLVQRLTNARYDGLRAFHLTRDICRAARPDYQLTVTAEALKLRTLDSCTTECVTNPANVLVLDELDLHESSAGELNAVVET